MGFEVRTFQQILQRLANRMVARSQLTDLEEGGELHTELAAFAWELDNVYFQGSRMPLAWSIDTAVDDDLDERGKDLNPDKITRRAATVATTTVVFSRPTTVGLVPIPIGHLVYVDDGPEFTTTATGTIPDGASVSAAVPVQATVAGSGANTDAGTITNMRGVAGVTGVTNPLAVVNGLDVESDPDYRSRMKKYLRSLPRGTPQSLEYAALTVDLTSQGFGRITQATAFERDPPDLGTTDLYVDDGAGTTDRRDDNFGSPEVVVASAAGGERRFFLLHIAATPTAPIIRWNGVALVQGVDYTFYRAKSQVTLLPTAFPTGLTAADALDAQYEWWTGLIAEAQKVINGDLLDRAGYPGYAAAGTRVYVTPPTVIQLALVGTLTVSGNRVEAVAKAKAAIQRYVNTLPVSGDVVLSELVAAAQSIAEVLDVTFTLLGNLTVGEGQVARVTLANIELL